jgi:hypothetical protein
MMPNAITLLFKEARDAFPPFEGKPTDNNLLLIRETLLPILMEIPYDQLGETPFPHGPPHGSRRVCCQPGIATFVRPIHLPAYNGSIANNATMVVCVCVKSAHKARLNEYTSYKAAKRGAAKFLLKTVDEVWYNDLKDANIFYTKVLALEIMTFLDANSGGLHAIDMISLHTNMHQYYVQVDDIPQYIIMLEDAQKKASERACPLPSSSLS